MYTCRSSKQTRPFLASLNLVSMGISFTVPLGTIQVHLFQQYTDTLKRLVRSEYLRFLDISVIKSKKAALRSNSLCSNER